MSKQVLIETQVFKHKPFTIVEGRGSSNMVVEGVLATAEVKNGNGRYYSRELWNRELSKYKDLIASRRACGELDHPDSQIINLKNVSHVITDAWWDGDHIMGKIELLPTPSGNILTSLFQNGIPVGVSSRGMGSLQQVGEMLEVQNDFDLLCWDFVSTPSNPGSFMYVTGRLNEGLQKPFDNTNSYSEVNKIVTEILCANGTCPLF